MKGAPYSWTLAETARALNAGEVTARELTEAYLERIQAVDAAVRSYLAVTADVALEQADAADARRQAGETGDLLGVPYALKDLFTTAGVTTTAGSRMLANYVPPDDAEVYRRLKTAGAVLLGKLNMDEFAMGSSTETSAFFPTRNPWDLSRVPGGSSGGSAAAVAADLCAFSLGTDTGGSVRQPAALCGVVGLKPTYGRISRYGMVAFASSLDQCGVLAKTSADAGRILETLAGVDPADPTTFDDGGFDWSRGSDSVDGLRIGVPRAFLSEGVDPGVASAFETALDAMVDAGAVTVPIEVPHARYAVAAYYVIAPAEASANLARYDGVRYGFAAEGDGLWERIASTRGQGFGPEVKRRIMLGTYALSSGYYEAYYGTATRVRGLLGRDFAEAFEVCDVIATPTAPEVAFPLRSRIDDPLSMYVNDIFTIPASLAGLPAISVPCGLSDGLPVGLQIVAPARAEGLALNVAAAYEDVGGWQRKTPNLSELASHAPEPGAE